MKYIILLITTGFCFSYQTNKPEETLKSNDFSFYVGTYTNGESEGIYKYLLKSNGSLQLVGLVAKSENPSFLTLSSDKKNLVAVNEINGENNTGTVESFLVEEDGLTFLNRSSTGGAHPCFVNVNSDGIVLTANYTGGNVGLLQLNKNGRLSDLLDTKLHEGKGTTERQEAPHVHSVWFVPKSNEVIAVDLGTNELWFYTINFETKKLVETKQQKLSMTAGSGPRHLAFHPNNRWVYVINELNCTVSLVKKNNMGNYKIENSVSTLPNNYNQTNTCADIRISADGRFLYASNRGHNSMVVYAVNTNGSLSLIKHEPTMGDSPRNFSLSPDGNFLVVANQKTNNLVSFKRDKNTGLLTYISEIEAPSPVCVLF